MNITHAVHEEVTGDRLAAIFQRQASLMEKYHDIEERSGLLQTKDCPVNLDDKRGQARIKDFAWRITEELGESLDATESEHQKEEMIDGLHFLTELTTLSGLSADELASGIMDEFGLKMISGDNFSVLYVAFNIVWYPGYDKEWFVSSFIRELGMMCNCLKNKPWKQSNMITDKKAFYSRLAKVWVYYYGIMVCSLMNDSEIIDIYFKKSQVNQFRQRSNY